VCDDGDGDGGDLLLLIARSLSLASSGTVIGVWITAEVIWWRM
jgi:hypothetical protein